jgi:ABC-2 type transport system permease protein
MNQLPVLIKREFWEHRSTFLILPAITTGFFLFIMLFALIAGTTDAINVTIDIDMEMSSDEQIAFAEEHMITGGVFTYASQRLDSVNRPTKERYLRSGLQGLAAPLLCILWLVVFFYLLGALYEERRDRSILFWKSMPVSDVMTVASKLVTALLVVPLVYLVGIATLQLAALIFLSIGSVGTDISMWDTIWAPASIFVSWLQYAGLLLLYGLWALPFFAWVLAVSAYAKSVPLVWAVGLPFGLGIVEAIFTGQSRVAIWMQDHTFAVRFINKHEPIAEAVQANVFSLQMGSALLVGGVLIFLAIWLRSKADEI